MAEEEKTIRPNSYIVWEHLNIRVESEHGILRGRMRKDDRFFYCSFALHINCIMSIWIINVVAVGSHIVCELYQLLPADSQQWK